MASTNKTPHLGLCQWVETDPLLMDDMNDTLEKIDAAIEERGRKKLLDMTVSEATSSVTLDFSEIPMEEYVELDFVFDFSSANKKMQLNGLDGGYSFQSHYSTSNGQYMDIYNGTSHASVTRKSMTFVISNGAGYYNLSSYFVPLKTARIFVVENNYKIQPGDRIAVWGRKW